MTTFLSPDELHQLTGYKRRKDQIAFLDSRRVPYRLNGMGDPVVTKTTAEQYVGGKQVIEVSGTPNWAALNALSG